MSFSPSEENDSMMLNELMTCVHNRSLERYATSREQIIFAGLVTVASHSFSQVKAIFVSVLQGNRILLPRKTTSAEKGHMG
jgi:hypothetical protein